VPACRSEESFNRLYCFAFHLLDREWDSMNATYMVSLGRPRSTGRESSI
jgi:hypothetical protein